MEKVSKTGLLAISLPDTTALSPLCQRGGLAASLGKSPFEKGGFRGIFMRLDKPITTHFWLEVITLYQP
jgi:hypothetical protein